MKIKNMQDLFTMELKDLYSAEHQILKALPKVIKNVSSPELKKALENHLEETKVQAERLDKISEILGTKLTGHTCAAMKGLVEEGDELIKEIEEGDVRDAALIGACQRIEHYEMAGYGCAETYAELLGQPQIGELLKATLKEEGTANKKLNQIALQSVNLKAARH